VSIALVGTGQSFAMNLLTAINFVLRGSGLDPSSDPTDENPEAGLAIEVITRTRREILESGFPFNTRKITLQVAQNGRVPISSAYLDLELPKGFTTRVDETDGERYVWDIENDDWHDEALERIPIIHDIADLAQIPEAFGRWIARQSAVNFFTEHTGSKFSVPKTLTDQRNEARAKAENTQPAGSIRTATRWASRLRRRVRT
jgi:hypothetical protein